MSQRHDTVHVLLDVGDERRAQNAKWGIQHHPDGTGHTWAALADAAREETDRAARDGNLTWLHILKEEFYEALVEVDPAMLRKELIQVAAVAIAWVEDIDSRSQEEVA